MSETTSATPSPEDAEPTQPAVAIRAQYVKDLSFENPGAPMSLAAEKGPPTIDVNVDVQARALAETDYEVSLRITATAKHEEAIAFELELLYAGVFSLLNIAAENRSPVCLIECPRLLFPFARRIVADATRDGGFPPLLLNPIDFATLYREHLERQGAAAQSDASPSDISPSDASDA